MASKMLEVTLWFERKSGVCSEAKISKTDGPLKGKGGLERWQHKRKPVGDGGDPWAFQAEVKTIIKTLPTTRASSSSGGGGL